MNNWDWNKMIPSWDFHQLAFDGYPFWQINSDNEPYNIRFQITKGKTKSSREIAIEWDDLSQGRFYYRDFTESGMPFVEENETYKTLFVFQYETDYNLFKEHFKL